MVAPLIFLSVGNPGIIISSDVSYLNSEIIFKVSVKERFPVNVKADTVASSDPELAINISGLRPNENVSENSFCKYKATPWYPPSASLEFA